MASRVTDRPILETGWRPSARPYNLSFVPHGLPVPLRTANRSIRLSFLVRIDYRVIEQRSTARSYEARIDGYHYEVLDRLGREILAYHWHPAGVSPVTEPHLHLSGRLRPLDVDPRDEPIPLGEMHLPTGFVMLAQMVRLLITEFGVEPRREDWETVLREPSAD